MHLTFYGPYILGGESEQAHQKLCSNVHSDPHRHYMQTSTRSENSERLAHSRHHSHAEKSVKGTNKCINED